jgi:hypothetical protein
MSDIYFAVSRGNPLDPETANKLARICGMFGSDHDGEIAAAARKAHHLLRSRGLTWREVIALPARATAEPETLSELCGWALACAEILDPWQTDFLRTVSGLKAITAKQRDQLNRIIAKARAYRAAGGAA